MKSRLPGSVAMGLLLLTQSLVAQSLDATFTLPSVYAPGPVYGLAEQPDGKRVVLGHFTRINGTTVPAIARLNPNGTLDAPFMQNLGAAGPAYRMRLQANGQLLLIGLRGVPLVAGGLTRNGLLRLNANGTADTGFDCGTGATTASGAAATIRQVLSLANGQYLVVGEFAQFNGVAVHNLARLAANGTVDASFNQGTGTDALIEDAVALPNGQLLIGGSFQSYNGTTRNGLALLNTDGTLDATFAPGLLPFTTVVNIIRQADGRLMLGGNLIFSTPTGGSAVARLLANGSFDTSFTPPAYNVVQPYANYQFSGGTPLQVQPDSKVVVLNSSGIQTVAEPATLQPVRLNADGTPDASFQPASITGQPNTIALLANGNLLVGGDLADVNGIKDRTLFSLTPTGAVDAAFQPVMQGPGTVQALALQPDGKYLIGGLFSEVNGQALRRLVRLHTDGSLDATFSTNAFDAAVSVLALQPDGRVLAASGYTVRRLLASGSPDASFELGTCSNMPTQLALQPDGRVFVGGPFNTFSALSGSQTNLGGVIRLTATGAYDNTFVRPAPGTNFMSQCRALALQPDGKLLASGMIRNANNTSTPGILRYTTSGAIDASFTRTLLTSTAGTNTASAGLFALQPDGKLLIQGLFEGVNGTPRRNLARLMPDGTVDATFAPPLVSGIVTALAPQPNGRVLVGGYFAAPGLPNSLGRLLPDGTADASFANSPLPMGITNAVLVQPDGKLLVGGVFVDNTQFGAAAIAVARLTAANVLHVAAPRSVAERTAAWPVPAHTTLNVQPDPTAHPLSLDLLDALGRPVRHQALSNTARVALPLENLPTGLYLLQVHYTTGSVSKRIQVQ